MLDIPCSTLAVVIDRIVQSLESTGVCTAEEAGLIQEALQLRHIHVGEYSRSSGHSKHSIADFNSKARISTTPANLYLAQQGMLYTL